MLADAIREPAGGVVHGGDVYVDGKADLGMHPTDSAPLLQIGVVDLGAKELDPVLALLALHPIERPLVAEEFMELRLRSQPRIERRHEVIYVG